VTTTGQMDMVLDWIVVAGVHGRGVRLLASKTLKPPTTVEIVEAEEDKTFRGKPVKSYHHEHYRITVLAEDVVIVDAETYSKAIQLLFTIFQPPEPSTPVAGMLGQSTQAFVDPRDLREIRNAREIR
jgi:hypothetical protein